MKFVNNMKKILLLLIAFICTANAFAVDFYWKSTGRADQNYTNAANWESAPGSGIPANGSLAPSSIDDVYFPAGNTTQTIQIGTSGAAANFNVVSTGVITFTNGTVSVYGSFTSNGKHLFASGLGMSFLGTGNHTINMGDTAAHGTGTFGFAGTGTYNLLSDFNVPGGIVGINNSTLLANGNWIKVGQFLINPNTTGTKTINLANSKLTVSGGASNVGALVIGASPATTSYDWTNAEIYINQTNMSTFINTGNATTNGTVINGIKSITFTETTPGITAEQIRCTSGPFTLNTTDFNINTSAFNVTGGSRLNLNTTNLNLLKPVDITSNGATQLSVNAINEAASCVGQSSLRSEGGTPISFNATSPISTTNIGFKSIAFSGSALTMPVNNDLGLNTGTYVTSTASTSRSFYWVGGTGNWNDPTKWSVLGSGLAPQTAAGCLPNYNDDVYFDANSFTASAQVVTIGSGASTTNMAYARNVYWTDPGKKGRLTGGGLNINGSADFSGSTGVSSALVYVGSGNHTVKSGSTNYTTGSIQFFGTGTYSLTDDLISLSALFQISAGTFNSNGKSIAAVRFVSSSVPYLASNVRHLDFSNSVLTFTHGNTGGNNTFVLTTPFLGSFNAMGSTINLTGVAAEFYVNGHNADVLLSTITFNDINFSANTGSSLFQNAGVLNFVANNINFSSNATIQQILGAAPTHRVNTYNFSPGKVYSFHTSSNASTAPVYTVVNSINSNSIGSCSPKVTIQSSSAGYRAKIYKASLPFEVSNAIIRDINATGVTMSVPGGEDLGNNLNVNITANPSQNFYWVGGTGNWNDASHWSIGISGGIPAVTNVNNCIPSITDDVFFDGNSFTAANQTVTLDNNANCRNMTWENEVSSYTPIFAGLSGFTLNTYGAVRLAPNMTFSFSGNWVMRGTSLTTNANSITTNGVAVRSLLTLNGGGRYDLLDNFTSNHSIRFSLGQFYTNSNNITAASLNLQVIGANVANISNSIITLNGTDGTNTYIAAHSSTTNWNATGSTINVNVRGISISTPIGVTIEYGTMNVNQSILATLGSGSGTLRFTNLNFLRATSSMSGRFIVDHLRYTNSSDNSIGSGSTVTVANSLKANGTPCNPIRFRSGTAGTPATFISTLCNFDLRFARLTDITAGGTCTAAQNKVVGDDAGGNSNWTFATIDAFEYLGADKVLKCNEYPYTLSTASFNADATSILWSNGATTPDITVTGPGTYSVTVTYGVGCNLTDAITLSLTPNPVLNAATIYACETTASAAIGDFNLTDANAILVSTPTDYTFTYHATSADAIANVNPLSSPYNSTSKTIYVRVLETATGCFSTRDIVLTVKPKVSPTASANQKICATVHTSLANLSITGTDIKWYTDALSTTVLPTTTLLVNGHTYYATQTVAGGCESDRIPVTVVLENCGRANPSLRMRVSQ